MLPVLLLLLFALGIVISLHFRTYITIGNCCKPLRICIVVLGVKDAWCYDFSNTGYQLKQFFMILHTFFQRAEYFISAELVTTSGSDDTSIGSGTKSVGHRRWMYQASRMSSSGIACTETVLQQSVTEPPPTGEMKPILCSCTSRVFSSTLA